MIIFRAISVLLLLFIKFEKTIINTMKYRLILVFCFIFNLSFSQQISIPRVDMMPDKVAPITAGKILIASFPGGLFVPM